MKNVLKGFYEFQLTLTKRRYNPLQLHVITRI